MNQLRTFLVVGVIALFTAGTLNAAPTSGNVTVAVGKVTVTAPDGGAAKELKAGDTVAVGSTVKTGADSRAVIVMTAKSAVRIAADSEVVITEMTESATEPKVLLDLKSGSLGALLKPGEGANMDFKVKTPSGVAAARGTFFAVVIENGKGFAQVKEGKIEIVPEKKEGN